MDTLLTIAPAAGRSCDLLAFGDPVADVVIGVPQPPGPGEKVVGRSLGLWAGGTTANVACAVSRLGMRAACFGRVGADTYGMLLRDSFAAFGVDAAFLAADADAASATAVTMVAPSGEKSLVYLPMPPAPTREGALRAALRLSRIVFAMPYDLDQFDLLSRLARDSGTLVAIDLEAAVAPNLAAMLERASRADIVFFNESGFAAGTGSAPTESAMRAVLDAGPRLVVVSRAAAGAVAVSRAGYAEQAAFPAVATDTTGAGDCFNGAFLVALMEGESLERALRFACAAASFAVGALGARSGLPDHRAASALAY